MAFIRAWTLKTNRFLTICLQNNYPKLPNCCLVTAGKVKVDLHHHFLEQVRCSCVLHCSPLAPSQKTHLSGTAEWPLACRRSGRPTVTWDSVCDPRVHGVASLELQLGFAPPPPLAWLEVTPLGDKHGEPGMLWLGADGHKTLRHCLGTSPYTVTQTVTLAIAAYTQHRTPEPYRCDIWIPSTQKKQHGSIVIFFFFLNHQFNKTDVSPDALWISIF